MPTHYFFPVLLVALILFNIYRRFQRTFGAQPIQPQRMAIRVVLLTALAGAALFFSQSTNALLGGMAGLLAGAALAILGLRLTRFAWTADGGGSYTPHAYIGGILFAAVLVRLAYRFIIMAPTLESMPQQSSAPGPSYLNSPLTLGIMLTLVGYYLVYFAGILLARRKHLGNTSTPQG